MFYNTNGQRGEELKKEWENMGKQEREVLDVFIGHPSVLFSPFDILRYINRYPITSIRRAITDLTKAGFLIKTDQMKIGPYGKPSYQWQLK